MAYGEPLPRFFWINVFTLGQKARLNLWLATAVSYFGFVVFREKIGVVGCLKYDPMPTQERKSGLYTPSLIQTQEFPVNGHISTRKFSPACLVRVNHVMSPEKQRAAVQAGIIKGHMIPELAQMNWKMGLRFQTHQIRAYALRLV